MTLPFTTRSTAHDIPIIPLTAANYKRWVKTQAGLIQQWLKSQSFTATEGAVILIPTVEGHAECALAIIPKTPSLWDWAAIASQLPASHPYYFPAELQPDDISSALLGWALESYRFDQFKANDKSTPTMRLPKGTSKEWVEDVASSVFLVRDLINRPANELTPATLADACREVAKECHAEYHEIVGDDLLKQQYPTIHAVGRACSVPPRLLDLRWGDKKAPKLTLVGKGVCFDTGGLNIKTGKSMGLMKKDMGGAAATLGLARLIMKQKLPVRLRVLIPAVENSIAGNAMRPQDIIRTRKGLTVEIGNTDAEGRLILCDALAEADTETPDLLIDMATLTGASRVALGPDIPSFFTDDDGMAEQLQALGANVSDPLWRLPLWQDYWRYMESDVADMDNSGSGGGYAGAITAALFLKQFISRPEHWLHVDMMAWNTGSRAGRPKGGEAQGLRTLFAYLEKRYRK